MKKHQLIIRREHQNQVSTQDQSEETDQYASEQAFLRGTASVAVNQKSQSPPKFTQQLTY